MITGRVSGVEPYNFCVFSLLTSNTSPRSNAPNPGWRRDDTLACICWTRLKKSAMVPRLSTPDEPPNITRTASTISSMSRQCSLMSELIDGSSRAAWKHASARSTSASSSALDDPPPKTSITALVNAAGFIARCTYCMPSRMRAMCRRVVGRLSLPSPSSRQTTAAFSSLPSVR